MGQCEDTVGVTVIWKENGSKLTVGTLNYIVESKAAEDPGNTVRYVSIQLRITPYPHPTPHGKSLTVMEMNNL